jgi:flagellar hook-basal body complex protein FliE
MSNLMIENLQGSAGLDGMGPLGTGTGTASESRVKREMENQGMQVGGEGRGTDAQSPTFARAIEKALGEVNQHQIEANQAIRELVAGRTKNIHETMLTLERADSSLKMMMQVRNKILDAYREIMRMQV